MKNKKEVPEPLRTILETIFHVEAYSGTWKRELEQWEKHDPTYPALIKKQIADAILNDSVSPEQYRALTGENAVSLENVKEKFLEIWKDFYGDEEGKN